MKDPRLDALADLNNRKIEAAEIIKAVGDFLAQLEVEKIPTPTEGLSRLLELYFSGSPPFDDKRKKSEFPDGANLIALLDFADATNTTVYVVSSDDDWRRVCEANPRLTHCKHLSEIIDIAIRAEWRSNDLWSDEDLLEYVRDQKETLLPMMQTALEFESTVNKGDGQIDSLMISNLFIEGIAVTYIEERGDTMIFSGEIFHSIWYDASVSIEDDEMNNTIEDAVSGSADLVARFALELPLKNPRQITILDVDYRDGLDLKISLSFAHS